MRCTKCFEIYLLFAVPKEEQITNAVETVDNPHDNKTIIESMKKRTNQSGKKITRSRKRKNIRSTNDADIAREIQQHDEQNVNIVYDSNP